MTKLFVILGLYFLLRSSFVFSSAPPDSIGYMYPLWDERNPDCPCHQLESKAKKLFEGQNIQKNESHPVAVVSEQITKTPSIEIKFSVKKKKRSSWWTKKRKSKKRRARTGRIDKCYR